MRLILFLPRLVLALIVIVGGVAAWLLIEQGLGALTSGGRR